MVFHIVTTLSQILLSYIYIYIFYRIIIHIVKVEVKWSRYRPGVAQRAGRVTALLFHDRGARRGWVVSSTPRPHFTPGIDPVPILQEAVWAPGPVWTGGKSRPHRDSIPDRPEHSSVAIPTELPGPNYSYCIWYKCKILYTSDISANCNSVDTRWQQYSAHLHNNNEQNNTMKQNTQNGTYITIRILKLTKQYII